MGWGYDFGVARRAGNSKRRGGSSIHLRKVGALILQEGSAYTRTAVSHLFLSRKIRILSGLSPDLGPIFFPVISWLILYP